MAISMDHDPYISCPLVLSNGCVTSNMFRLLLSLTHHVSMQLHGYDPTTHYIQETLVTTLTETKFTTHCHAVAISCAWHVSKRVPTVAIDIICLKTCIWWIWGWVGLGGGGGGEGCLNMWSGVTNLSGARGCVSV